MKRYLTVGIIFGVLVAIVVAISWFWFPAWKDPASGGFWTLLGLSLVGVFTFVKDGVSVWKDLREDKKEEAKPISTNTDLDVGGNVGGNLTSGNNNVVSNVTNNYYQQVVEKNIEKHEPDFWALKHPYPMPPNFTGRIAERAMLTHWLKEDSENRLFILRALGGFGKSALTWHWLTHDVDIKEYPKVVFWSFYEGDASFEHFIEETLKYLKLEVPQGQRPQVDELLKAMQGQNILLIMDGFERALRAYSSMNAAYQGDEAHLPAGDGKGEGAYDCVNIHAETFLRSVCSLPNIKSKVLMTTRLTPRAVKPRGEFMLGCRETELTSMQPADAVEFFHKQKIKGTHAEIEVVCAAYGYHPLSLRLLAGRIVKDFENPADIVVAQKLKIDGDIIQQKHHVLEVSYNSLSPHEQKLLSTVACFRFSVDLKTIRSITEDKDVIDTDLRNLVDSGLLHFDEKSKKFNLHSIVQSFVYERLNREDRIVIHKLLCNHFEKLSKPEKFDNVEDLASTIEWWHHTISSGDLDNAVKIFKDKLHHALYYQFHEYQTTIELLEMMLPNVEDDALFLEYNEWQAWALNSLAIAYSMIGQPRTAATLLEKSIKMRGETVNKDKFSPILINLAIQQIAIGFLRMAESNIRRRIQIRYDLDVVKWEDTYTDPELGRVLSIRGLFDNADKEFKRAEKISGFLYYAAPGENIVVSYQAWHALLTSRTSCLSRNENLKSAIEFAQRALEISNEMARDGQSSDVDFIRASWLLGEALCFDKQTNSADHHLNGALHKCREINLVELEANILLDLARLRYDQKNYEEAKSLADEALLITERCGYVLQGADVNLFLAQYALEQEKDKAKAKQYAEEAKKLATCDGPPYYYKVAYEEAERMLENLK